MDASRALSAPKALAAWWLAIRPGTLTIAMVPVVVGSALAVADGAPFDPTVALAALAAAVLIQIGTNLQNDVGDWQRGADSGDRLGPPRATSLGWLSPAQVRRGAIVACGLAFALGGYLVWRGGWPIVLIGVSAITVGLAYTSGRRPIAYTAFGELFVFLFFGLVAVGGAYYLQTLEVGRSAVIAGALIGMLAAAVLVVNNYRDIDSDRRAGKHTVAVCFGAGFARRAYAFLVLAPFPGLPLLARTADAGARVMLALAVLPWAVRLVRQIYTAPPGAWLNRLLGETALLQLAFGLLLAAALSVG